MKRGHKKLKRKRPLPMYKIKSTPVREKLIKHVLIYHPYWKNTIECMSNEFLLAHAHMDDRDTFKLELIEEELNLKNK